MVCTVLLNPDCPHCRQAAERIADLAERAHEPVAFVDATAHPEVAEAWHVRHSPSLCFGEDDVVTGTLDEATFRAHAHR